MEDQQKLPQGKQDLRQSHKANGLMSPIPEDKPKPHRSQLNQRVGVYAGPYRLLETLGKGGLATVKVGVDFSTGCKVAVKIIEKEKLSNPREQVSMAREITIMKLLKHKNILRLYDVYESEEKVFLILDLFEGGDLYGHLTAHGAMRPSEAVVLFRQLIEGVEFCHKNVIVHRDLKPENLLLSSDKKHLVLSDFGLSTGMAGSRNFLKTRCGTVHYISPEVAKGDPYIGMASDIWSCGIILYAMVSATLPFDGETSIAVLKKIVKGDYVMPAYLSPDLQDLIRKMLDHYPNNRITITEIKEHPWYKLGADKDEKNTIEEIEVPNITLTPNELEDNKHVLDNLLLLGWEVDDLRQHLLSELPNQAKLFYHLLITYKNKPSKPNGVQSPPGRRRAASIDNGNDYKIVSRPTVERKPTISSKQDDTPSDHSIKKERKIVRKDENDVIRSRSRRAATISDGSRPEQIDRRPWGISPTTEPNAKIFSVESKKTIEQILDNLRNCFGQMQLEMVEKRTKSGVKVKGKLKESGNGKKKGKSNKVVRVDIKPSDQNAESNVIQFKNSKKETRGDFTEVLKKIENTLIV